MIDFRLFHSRMIRTAGRGPDLSETKPVSLSNDPPRRGGRGRDLSETTEKRQKKKSYPRRAIEERRRATKALRLTATGYQGHDGIVDFRLFCSRMICPAGQGPHLSETKEKRVIHKGPRRTDKSHPPRKTTNHEWTRMNTNKLIDELLIGGCDNRHRGVIYEGHEAIPR